MLIVLYFSFEVRAIRFRQVRGHSNLYFNICLRTLLVEKNYTEREREKKRLI
jgi:hypothetical protein